MAAARGGRGGKGGSGREASAGSGGGAGEPQIQAVPSLAADDAEDDRLYAFAVRSEGGLRPQHRTLKLFHGTSWENAKNIKREGKFNVSTDGCLGPGIYVGREDKARRYLHSKRCSHRSEDRRAAGASHALAHRPLPPVRLAPSLDPIPRPCP